MGDSSSSLTLWIVSTHLTLFFATYAPTTFFSRKVGSVLLSVVSKAAGESGRCPRAHPKGGPEDSGWTLRSDIYNMGNCIKSMVYADGSITPSSNILFHLRWGASSTRAYETRETSIFGDLACHRGGDRRFEWFEALRRVMLQTRPLITRHLYRRPDEN